MNIAIIGGGIAASHTALELRRQGATGEITIFSAEPHAPYDRPPLSKELLTRTDPVPLSVATGADLSTIEVTYLSGAPVTSVVPAAMDGRWVVSSPTHQVEVDQVVFATGLAPRNPWPGTFSLHTLDDATRLRAALTAGSGHLSEGKKVIVIGAGWVGAELAWHLHTQGHQVTVLEAGPYPLWRQLGQVGELTRGWYQEAGIDLRTGIQVRSVAPGPQGQVVHSDAGEFAADVVVSAMGANPNLEWFVQSFPPARTILTPGGHIRVDEHYRTTIPGIWAVGDVAQHPARVGGHWFDAMRDPAVLAAALLGEPVGRQLPAEMFSEQFGRRIVALGNYTGSPVLADPTASPDQAAAGGQESVSLSIDEDASGGFVAQYRTAEGTLLGAVVCDLPRAAIALRKELRKNLPRS